MVLADFDAYVACQKQVEHAYRAPNWDRMSILNTARIGTCSSHRSVQNDADDIWPIKPVPIDLVNDDSGN